MFILCKGELNINILTEDGLIVAPVRRAAKGLHTIVVAHEVATGPLQK